MDYLELQDLLKQVNTPDELEALNMLLTHHYIAPQTLIYELSTKETKA